MSAADTVLDTQLRRRAVSTHTRAVAMLLGLLPGLAIQAWSLGPAFTARITGVLLGVVVARVVSRERHSLRDWSPMPLLMALLAFLWLPGSSPWWLGLGGAVLAYGITRVFNQTCGASAFHPAMIGAATVLLFAFPSAASFPPDSSMSCAVAGAWIGAGIVLAACRCIRWQVVVAVWLGAALAALAWLSLGGHPPTTDAVAAALPGTALIPFFIATDPSSGCMVPRARWLFGAGVGVLSLLALLAFHDRTQVLLGMAGAVLLMNASAPWLDAICERPRFTPHSAQATSP